MMVTMMMWQCDGDDDNDYGDDYINWDGDDCNYDQDIELVAAVDFPTFSAVSQGWAWNINDSDDFHDSLNVVIMMMSYNLTMVMILVTSRSFFLVTESWMVPNVDRNHQTQPLVTHREIPVYKIQHNTTKYNTIQNTNQCTSRSVTHPWMKKLEYHHSDSFVTSFLNI